MDDQRAGSAGDTYDIVIVGVGLAGVATGLACALRGLRPVIVEKEPKLQGASWWSGGQVWVPANHVQQREGLPDSLEEGMEYVRGLAAERPESVNEEHLKRWLSVAPQAVQWFEDHGAARFGIIGDYPDYEHGTVSGSRAEGRYLSATFDARQLGAWRDKLSPSGFFPVGTSYDLRGLAHDGGEGASTAGGVTAFGASAGVHERAADAPVDEHLLAMGAGVVSGFFARAIDAGVEVRLGHRVTEVLMRDGRAAGVRAVTQEGHAVELHGPVVLATSGIDHDPVLVEELFDREEHFSFAPPNIAGDGIRLARAAGADVVTMDPRFAPLYPGCRADRGATPVFEHSFPHSFVVDRHGRRFADESVAWRIARQALEPPGDHMPMYLVWDEQHHQRYGLALTPPGGEYPADVVASAPTLGELGDALGIDGAALEETAARFNRSAATGEDPEFGRGTSHFGRVIGGDASHPVHPNVAPVARPPFFGTELVLASAAVALSGIRIDGDAHALDEHGDPIPGLYAAGSAAAFTTSGVGYNSGWALSRAVTHGYLIGAELAGA